MAIPVLDIWVLDKLLRVEVCFSLYFWIPSLRSRVALESNLRNQHGLSRVSHIIPLLDRFSGVLASSDSRVVCWSFMRQGVESVDSGHLHHPLVCNHLDLWSLQLLLCVCLDEAAAWHLFSRRQSTSYWSTQGLLSTFFQVNR